MCFMTYFPFPPSSTLWPSYSLSAFIFFSLLLLTIFATERLNFWGERRDYYHYLTEQLSDMKDLEVVSKKILRFPQVWKSAGLPQTAYRLKLVLLTPPCALPLHHHAPPLLPANYSSGEGKGTVATVSLGWQAR